MLNQLNSLTVVLTPAKMKHRKLTNFKRLAGQPLASAMTKIQKLYTSCYYGTKEVSPDPSSPKYDLALAQFMQDALLILVTDELKSHLQTYYDKARATNTQIHIEPLIISVARHEYAHNLFPVKHIALCTDDKKKHLSKSLTVSLNSILPTQAGSDEDSDDEEFKAKKVRRNKMLVESIRNQQKLHVQKQPSQTTSSSQSV